MTSAQRAKLIAMRKAAYEGVHPETKHGGVRRGSSPKVEDLKSFAAETAAKSSRSRQSVERDAARAKRLGVDLDRVAGTSLNEARGELQQAKHRSRRARGRISCATV